MVQLRMQRGSEAGNVGVGKGVDSVVMFEGTQTINF